METLGRTLKVSSNGLQRAPVALFIMELMNASTRMHITHLSITGEGSFAAHKALDDFYNNIKSLADDLAEQYQGVTESILNYPSQEAITKITTSDEAIDYLRELYSKTDITQSGCPYSEIKNTLDEIKSLINSTKYKLIFLQ